MNQLGRLTPLQTKIYRELQIASYAAREEDRWLDQRRLVDAVNSDPSVGKSLKYNERDYNHCRAIWTAINAINQSGCVEKIIVTKRYRYKLGTAEECEEYFAKQRKDALKKLARLTFLKARADANGQGLIVSEDGAVRWLESLLPEAKEALREEAAKHGRG